MVGMTFVGIFVFWVTTFGMFLTLESAMSAGFTADTRATVLATVMSVVGLAGGLALTIWGRDWVRGLGIGLMIGWATVAISTGLVVGCFSMLEGLE